MTFAPTRRHFLQSTAAFGAAMAGAPGVALAQSKPLPFRYAYSAISWGTNIEEAVRVGERLGFPGVEPFRNNIMNYIDKPLALKKFMSDHHIQMATCSNGGGPNFSGNFVDPAKIDQSVKDHINFARTFIAPFLIDASMRPTNCPRCNNGQTYQPHFRRCAGL